MEESWKSGDLPEEQKVDLGSQPEETKLESNSIPDTAYEMVSNDIVFGLIRQLDGEKYDHTKHQSQYNQLSSFVIDFVQKQMREKFYLQEVWIPEKIEPFTSLPKCNIFMSQAFRFPNREINSKQRALVLIQGSGAVRAGIWARSVCINEGLEKGSMLPFIDLCKKLDIAVLVMNPNFNRDPETGVTIPYS